MKKSYSLRNQLFAVMALLVLLQSFALVAALAISRVYTVLDAEAFRLFDSATNARMQSFNTNVEALVGNMAGYANTMSTQLQQAGAEAGIPESELYRDDDAYLDAVLEGTPTLIDMLQGNTVSGAFLFLNGSNANKEDEGMHSGVYLRSSVPGATANDSLYYSMEIGPIAVSQAYYITSSVNWDLDIALPAAGRDAEYYTQPVWAAAQYKNAEFERYGYWSPPIDILGDQQSVITYTMPLLDGDGNPFGILGVEISLPLFSQHYLPNTDLPYQNSFYAIAAMQQNAIALDWYLPSGPLAEVYLKKDEELPLKELSSSAMYETHIEGLGAMYCSVQPLQMYSQNSPFYDDSWSLIGFVPMHVLHETSSGVRKILTASIIITTAAAFVVLFILVFFTTRKIRGLSSYIKTLSPTRDIHFSRTGILEIDDLTSAVERLNQSVANASKTTSKILELTLLPIGGFEVSSNISYVVLTEYVYQLVGIEPGKTVSREEWAQIYETLTCEPAPAYENIYRYSAGEDSRWLRILETKTETGVVGVILDVTKDIEEHRRLAHELDYDALTLLYNRTAFKREAHELIQKTPDKIGAMIFADLDNLKYINDNFGHDMGDRLIIRAGEMFREFERAGGIVSRISGDEFAIYLHGFDNKAQARKVIAEQYQKQDAYSLETPDGSFQKIRSSSGIAYYPDDSDNITDLLKLSDYAMYEAKHSRKGSAFEFNMNSYLENSYLLENREAINRLLDEKLIRFAFQPIVDLKTGEIYAYEALMRPLLENFKSPLEILAVAAAQSKLGQLERLVMFTAFEAVANHIGTLGKTKVFINSIPSQSLSGEDHLLLKQKYSDLFGNIVVEITESSTDFLQHLKDKLDFIRANGMQIAVDDFGSGYSNEIRILAMSPDVLKIDMGLISNIDQNPDKQQLIANLVSFCHPKGVKLIAEGVERSEELAKLVELDVDYVQGYYLARPDYEFRQLPEDVHNEILRLNRP